MPPLLLNMLLQWPSSDSSEDVAKIRVERILWIEPGGTSLVTININSVSALPVWQNYNDYAQAIQAGQLRIVEKEPDAILYRPEDSISEASRKIRDDRWKIIEPLINAGIDIFVPEKRGPLITEVQKQTKCTKWLIYSHLRKYWQGGQSKNALLPPTHKYGGKGKTRRDTLRKRGRPIILNSESGKSTGINVTDEIRVKIKRGLRIYFLNKGVPDWAKKSLKLDNVTLKEAYQFTLETEFSDGTYISSQGAAVPNLLPLDKCPTLVQFTYWLDKLWDVEQKLKQRKGNIEFQRSHRSVLGDSTKMAFAPGSLYMVDPTVADLYLVSRLDPTKIIGRPIIYVLIDVFSRMIVGLAVTLEGPSWLGAMLALENAFARKREYCKEYGVEINEALWPCHYLPIKILADRAEFEGYNADNLTNALNITVINTPPYRCDWKGIVERVFRIINDRLLKWIPGNVSKEQARGGEDYRLDACLTLDEFRKLLIMLVLKHNNHHEMTWYNRDEFMIAQHVGLTPLELWNWGIENRSGSLATKNEEIVRLNLLPSGKARVTEEGIRFRGERYDCKAAHSGGDWYVKARNEGSWVVDVAWDPRQDNVIYLRLPNSDKILEPCHIISRDKSEARRNWYETQLNHYLEAQAAKAGLQAKHQSEAELNAEIGAVLDKALERKETLEKASGPRSKSSRVSGISDNRQVEREMERAEQLGRLLGPASAQSTVLSSIQSQSVGISPSEEMLIRKQQERLQNEKK